uniref:E3 ubiquitin/ISG15 ligase TRIM25-like isoform X1 n=2 Tax=Myxine glutinosa TaxID=7769 RepID=UPI0035901612
MNATSISISLRKLFSKVFYEMAESCHARICHDDLKCGVCLDLFMEPVTLVCGHSFCLDCVEHYWVNRGGATRYTCPTCRQVFSRMPQLSPNVVLSRMVAQMKLQVMKMEKRKSKAKTGDGVPADKEEEMPGKCEVCKEESVKFCVPCEIQCCSTHVKPHQKRGHKLVEPDTDVEALRCTQHGQLIQLYCKDDGTLMCPQCMPGSHQHHEVLSVEAAHIELKKQLTEKMESIQESRQNVAAQLQQLRLEQSHEQKRNELHEIVDEVVDIMKARVKAKENAALASLRERKHYMEREMQAILEAQALMQQEMNESNSLGALQLHSDIQHRLAALEKVANTPRTPVRLDVSEEVEQLDAYLQLNKDVISGAWPPHVTREELEREPEMALMLLKNLRCLYGNFLTLDSTSAHPELVLSRDLRTVTRSGSLHQYPDFPQRFDHYAQVVGVESFSLERLFWEVDVSRAEDCSVGVAYASLSRKGDGSECKLGANSMSWCIRKCDDVFTALHDGQETLLDVPGIHQLSFYLNCDAGELMVYMGISLVHTFKATFNQPLLPALQLCRGQSLSFCPLN